MNFPDYFDEEDFMLFLKEARLAGLSIGSVILRDGMHVPLPGIVLSEGGWVYIKEPDEEVVTYDLTKKGDKRGWWKFYSAVKR